MVPPNPALIADILRRYPKACQPMDASCRPAALGGAGGLSGAQLWRLTAWRGVLLLRRWPDTTDATAPDRWRWIHACLERTRMIPCDPFPIPVPLPASDGETLIADPDGGYWEVTPWMPGCAWDLSRGRPPVNLARCAFLLLAQLHGCWDDFPVSLNGRRSVGREGAAPGLIKRRLDILDWRNGGLARLRSALQSKTPLSADEVQIHEDANRWLALAEPHWRPALASIERALTQPVRIRPCIRDLRSEHWLFDESRGVVTGLVDFGAMDADSVVGDLARILVEWTAENTPLDREFRHRVLEAYQSVRPLREEEWACLALWEYANRLLIAGQWLRWFFLEPLRTFPTDVFRSGITRGLACLQGLNGGSGGIVLGR